MAHQTSSIHQLPSATRLFAVLLFTIAAVEMLVMVLLPYLVATANPYVQNLVDASLLTLLSAPFLWKLVARPLRSLAHAEASRARALLTHMDSAVIGFDARGLILSMNPAAERMFNYAAPEALGETIARLLPDLETIGVLAAPEKTSAAPEKANRIRLETTGFSRDGGSLPLEVSVTDLWLEGEKTSIAIARDIRERKQYEEQLAYQANHDALTRLPNRNLLNDRIRQALLLTRRQHQKVAVFCIDLDNFKYLNDSLGHQVGDQLLKMAAERLSGCLRTEDTLARQGGDEFVVVIANPEAAAHASSIAAKILETVSRPFTLREHEFVITCSIGISISPRDGADVETLVKHADLAMYRAKEQGRNCFQFYTAEMNARSLSRLTMEKHLRRAIEQDELQVHYQPKVNLGSGRIVGMEALVRWQNPELGMVSPGHFIPLAEEIGLIESIGEWVLRTACRQNKAWQAAGLPPLPVAVNLSPRQFLQQDIVALIDRALGETGLAPRWLELEITESMLMQESDRVQEIMSELKRMGVCLTMDDFGTGYSSLSYLKRFSFDKLKIDQSFVRDITTDPDNAAIARAIIAMAHSLNLEVIAEGVETLGQLNYLRRQDCDVCQGYYFSRPVPADQFESLLRAGRALRTETLPRDTAEKTLLVLDDDPQVLAALKRLFQLEGYRVLTAESAKEGFELMADHQVAVVISDQRMPVMSGCEFLSRIKKLYPDSIRIILSGHADLDSVTDAINNGAAYKFLSKPWDEKCLLETVNEAFRSQKASPTLAQECR
jgi:diguanylate cyclase (GGDEF)-like protein/PAS domain S-box-containing protein